MLAQETFLERRRGANVIAVVKTYDQKYAREAFQDLNEAALGTLAHSLKLEDLYEREDIPSTDNENYRDFLWDTLLEESREDGSVLSFFVVYREVDSTRENLLVTSDWPTAEAFASRL